MRGEVLFEHCAEPCMALRDWPIRGFNGFTSIKFGSPVAQLSNSASLQVVLMSAGAWAFVSFLDSLGSVANVGNGTELCVFQVPPRFVHRVAHKTTWVFCRFLRPVLELGLRPAFCHVATSLLMASCTQPFAEQLDPNLS